MDRFPGRRVRIDTGDGFCEGIIKSIDQKELKLVLRKGMNQINLYLICTDAMIQI